MLRPEPWSPSLLPAERGSTTFRFYQTIALVFWGLVIAFLYWLFTYDRPAVEQAIRQAGGWGIVVSILAFTGLGTTVLPSEPLNLLVTGLFGPLTGGSCAFAGNLLANLVVYALGRHLGEISRFETLRAGLPYGLNRVRIDSLSFLLLVRLLPGFGSKLVCLLAGAARVRFSRFLWTAALQTGVGGFLVAFGGWELLRILFNR